MLMTLYNSCITIRPSPDKQPAWQGVADRMQLHIWRCSSVHKLISPNSLAHALISFVPGSVAQAGVPFLVSCWSL